ncbi:MAG TPA: hypothetical protein P5186_18755 [Candidatus Paceibacterota bacterium]|nr:hypothetical protein [Verrucomicrobiota bacterium]HRY50096.1 hypothetical protein [Candidatus Paceibacterota bacterium]
MAATRVLKSFQPISPDPVAELIDPAMFIGAAPMPVKEPPHPSQAREQWPADDRETARVQPYNRWGIKE